MTALLIRRRTVQSFIVDRIDEILLRAVMSKNRDDSNIIRPHSTLKFRATQKQNVVKVGKAESSRVSNYETSQKKEKELELGADFFQRNF